MQEDLRADALKRPLHRFDMLKVFDKRRNDRDNNNRRCNDAERGKDSADNTLALIADKGCRVDGNDARRTLADGEIVHQLLLGRPLALVHNLALQNRQHGVAAAEGEAADLGENGKQKQ